MISVFTAIRSWFSSYWNLLFNRLSIPLGSNSSISVGALALYLLFLRLSFAFMKMIFMKGGKVAKSRKYAKGGD